MTVFLEQVLQCLPDWISSLKPFPVVSWSQFVKYLHLMVNPLAGEEHLKEVIQQLQLMGEVVYLKCEEADLIILQPRWLFAALCGPLLSPESHQYANSSGSYTREQWQLHCPEYDAKDVLMVLSALGVCSQVVEGEELQYEFPCYNKTSQDAVSWDQDHGQWSEYGGVMLRAGAGFGSVMWPRIQTMLRRSVSRKHDDDTRLIQWRTGSKLQSPPLEALVEHRDNQITVKVRGPDGAGRACFYFLEEILGIIDQVLLEMSPGLPVDKLILSSQDLKDHTPSVMTWSPGVVMSVMMKEGWSGSLVNTQHSRHETLQSLLCFNSDEVSQSLLQGHDVHVSGMSTVTRQSLCVLLDPPHHQGRDWCMLAVQMGLVDKVPKLDVGAGNYSQTARLLDEWGQHQSSSIGTIIY